MLSPRPGSWMTQGAALAAALALLMSCGRTTPTVAKHGRKGRAARLAAEPFVAPPAPPCLELCRYLRTLARAGEYDMLDAEFDTRERAMAADCGLEGDLMDAAGCFDTTDPSLEPALDGWVDARPRSWAARISRASYHGRVASLMRTTHWANEVSPEQWAGYRTHSELAAADLREVIRTRAATLPAYTLLLGTEQHHADAELLARALDIAPFSLQARRRYLWYLQPKWGGSLEEMEAFVAEAERQADRYPKLRYLSDALTQARAEGPWRAGELETADRIFSEALDKGESSFLRVQRASVRFAQKRVPDGMADLEKAIARGPCYADALQSRAYMLAYQKRDAEARADYDRLLEIDPLAPDIRFGAAFLHFHEGNLEAAARDLRVVTMYDPINRSAWNNLGFAQLELGRTAEAEESLTHAIDLDDAFVHTRYKRGKARYLLGKESAFEDLQAFVDRKKEALDTPQEGGDPAARLAWAAKALAAPRDGTFPLRGEAPR